jgi:hypothetical protein
MPTAPTTQLFPAVVDASTLGQKQTSPIYLPIGIEGQGDNAGDATLGVMYSILRTDQAVTKFGPASRLTALINGLLARGAGPVIAVASKKGSAPLLSERQTAWALMESDPNIRIRLTDSLVQADLAALATSMANAALVNHKQVALVGMASGTTKAALITAATAIAAGGKEAATRSVLVGPGVYDEFGTLQDGGFAAMSVAAEVAKNGNPANDLDLFALPLLTAIEKDSFGMPIFREKVVSGVAVNDYEDLLQGGVSPLMTPPIGLTGGVAISHIRTVYVTDTTHDALMTRLIEDQIFLDVKQYVLSGGFLQQGNTPEVRKRIQSGVDAVLHERISWLQPINLPDGSVGYGVTVTSSTDQRQVTVSYQGQIVRGIQTVQVSGNLSITV